MSRKRNFTLPNALRAKRMEVIIDENLFHEENEDPVNYASLRFPGSRDVLHPVENVFSIHTETHLLLFQERLSGAASSTRSEWLNLLNNEIKELSERITYRFFHDGSEREQIMKKEQIIKRYPQLWHRITAIENDRRNLIGVLKNTEVTTILDNCGIRMRVTAKELAFLSSVLIDNDFLKIERLNPTTSANHKLSGLLSQVKVIENRGNKRPEIGGNYDYSKKGIRNYQTFLGEYLKDDLGKAIYNELHRGKKESKTQYILDANEELQKGLGLK